MKRWIKFGSIGLALALIAVLVITLMPTKVDVTPGGVLSLSTRIALVVQQGTMGDGRPVPQDAGPVLIRSGGAIPITAISYEDGIHVKCGEPFADIHFTRAQIEKWVKDKTTLEAEQIIEDEMVKHLEVWTLLSDYPLGDPVRQEPPILFDKERIEHRQGKDWLVTTLLYFDIHLYNMDFHEGDFTTRFQNVDTGLITEDWWPE